MRFAFDDDQLEFAAALKEVLSRECPPEVVRAAWDGAPSTALWSTLSDMGVVGLLAAETDGGLGLADIDLVSLLFEAGRVAAPIPLVDVAAVAVPTLSSFGTDEQSSIVSALADGSRRVALGLLVDRSIVAQADAADDLLLEAHDGLHLVPISAVQLEALESVDGSRRLARVTWTPSAATRLADPAAASSSALDRAAVATAAELCGLSRTMLDLTVAYVSERKQFGVPVGSYQALKHRLADALLALEFAQPLVWRAAQSVGDGHPEASVHASMAKAAASDAGGVVAEAALQCHGAIGYTVEYDLHLFLKRTWALQRRVGDAAWHRRRVRRALLG